MWRLKWGIALGHIGLIAEFLIGHFIHAYLRLGGILLIFLGVFGTGVRVFLLTVILASAVWIFFLLAVVFAVVVLIIKLVRIVAQLVAISQVTDDLAGKFGKFGLIRQLAVKVFKRVTGLIFHELPPEVHYVLCSGGQVTAGCEIAHQIASSDGQWRFLCGTDLRIALAVGLGRDLGVNITSGAGHVARAHCLTPRGFHRLINVACSVTLRHIALMRSLIVISPVQRQSVGGATGDQYLVAGHPAADLWQAHGVPRQTRGIDRIADRKIGVIGHHFGGLGEGFFERISGVVSAFHRFILLSSVGVPAPATPRRGCFGPASLS